LFCQIYLEVEAKLIFNFFSWKPQCFIMEENACIRVL
jgi:hypothetical protein